MRFMKDNALLMKLNELLEPDNRANRYALRKLFTSDAVFVPKYNLTLKEERELALERLKRFCLPTGKYISVFGTFCVLMHICKTLRKIRLMCLRCMRWRAWWTAPWPQR